MTANSKRASLIFLVLVAGLAAIFGAFALLKGRDVTTGTGIPAIGGPFNLVNQDGRTVTDRTYRGKFLLIYFGYSFCPDVCPTALTTLADAVRLLGQNGDKILPMFITVDPQRDTAEHLKMYVEYFHPRMEGLTGTPEQVAAVAREYRVYFAKVADKDAPDDDSYVMDHTSVIYLMGPDGRFVTHFTHGTDAQKMAGEIRRFL